MMTRILVREWEDPWVSGFVFKAVVQEVLLFGSDTWVVTPLMGRDLGGVPVPGGATADGAAPAEEN